MAFSLLGQIFGKALSFFAQFWIIIWLSIWCYLVPLVSAARTEKAFPDISFSAFNQIIETNFGSKISLATVLMLLFTLTENVDLLNLHFRQQHPEYNGENKTHENGWMIALAKAINENRNVPPLAETAEVPDQPHSRRNTSLDNSDVDMDADNKTVTMVVLDGIVMGPTVSLL